MVLRSIRKFQEIDSVGAHTGRVINAVDPTTIPLPRPGTEWREDAGFSEPDELRRHSGVQPVLDYAREHGHAAVEPADWNRSHRVTGLSPTRRTRQGFTRQGTGS